MKEIPLTIKLTKNMVLGAYSSICNVLNHLPFCTLYHDGEVKGLTDK